MIILWKHFSSWVSIFMVWLKITSSWIRKFVDFVFVPNKICWYIIFNVISFTGFQNFEKASKHYINEPYNYVNRSGTCILTCSFSQLFFCIYQLRIGTKSAFEFHNHRSVQISVILSNLKIFKKSSEIILWARTFIAISISIKIY